MVRQDPIVEETRELREEYAAKFENDADAIFADILRRQENSERERVAFTPRVPVSPQDDCVAEDLR